MNELPGSLGFGCHWLGQSYVLATQASAKHWLSQRHPFDTTFFIITMCIGIAIDAELLTETFLSRFGLRSRMHSDLFNSPQELQFRYNDPIPQLPIQHAEGEAWELVLWGNRDNPISRLPRTGWAREESVLAGKWAGYQPEPVIIPAQRGCEKGVWFPVSAGMQGLLVADEHRTPHVYMLTREATPEYAALTKHDRMPIFV